MLLWPSIKLEISSLIWASFSEGVEDSVNTMDLQRVRRLMGKSGGEVINGMFEHVDAVDTEVLRFWAENLRWKRRDGAWRWDISWLLRKCHSFRFVHPRKLWTV